MKKIIFPCLIILLTTVVVSWGVVKSRAAPNHSLSSVETGQIESDITALLKAQDGAWNRGDIDGFMQDYVKSDSLRFASGGEVKRGWQETLDGYKVRYPTKAAMGTLAFTDLEIDVLSQSDALVFGRWELIRDGDRPGGLFTLHMIHGKEGWKIKSDHTSANAP